MGFSDRDATASREVTERPMAIRVERADGATPPVNIHVVMEVDGYNTDLQVPRETLEANWDGPTKTLKAWVLAIIDAAE